MSFDNFCNFLSTANLSAERKKMPLAGLNIPEHLFEDGRSIRYAAIRAPLTTDLTDHRAVRRFQETGQFTSRPGFGRKRATTHRDDRFLNI
jgi:hypothetical protein